MDYLAGLASGGGAVALLSFAANLPNPDYALRALLPGLLAFCSGVTFAGLAVLTASFRVGESEAHHGAVFNRDELDDAIRATPIMFSAPESIAEKHNKPRDALIKQRENFHERAEAGWTKHMRWKRANRACLALSAASFLVGIAAPLVHVASGGSFVRQATVISRSM